MQRYGLFHSVQMFRLFFSIFLQEIDNNLSCINYLKGAHYKFVTHFIFQYSVLFFTPSKSVRYTFLRSHHFNKSS